MSSVLQPLENFIHKLDTEGAAELAAVKTDFENRFTAVLPLLSTLRSDVTAAVKDAAEEAAPGLRAALTAAIDTAEAQIRTLLGV